MLVFAVQEVSTTLTPEVVELVNWGRKRVVLVVTPSRVF